MSFWSGVVQGVKDIDVLKEKEALADERQGVRDEETARYNADTARQKRLDGLQATQYAAAEARRVEAHALTMTTGNLAISQTIANAGGGARAGGGPRGGSGSVPTAAEMNAGARALRARLDAAGGVDEMSSADQAYFKPILDNEAASFELNNLLEMAVGDNQDLTVLNAAERVRVVAIVAAQGQEAFAEFNRTSTAEGWNPESVLKAMELAADVNPAFAELVLLTPSVDNLTQEEVYTTLESQMQLQAAVWAKIHGESTEFTTALGQLGDSNATNRSIGLTALVGMGVAQSWIYDNTNEGDLLRILSGPPVSAVPTVDKDGELVTADAAAAANVPTFSSIDEILALPEAERLALVDQRVIIGGKAGFMQGAVPEDALAATELQNPRLRGLPQSEVVANPLPDALILSAISKINDPNTEQSTRDVMLESLIAEYGRASVLSAMDRFDNMRKDLSPVTEPTEGGLAKPSTLDSISSSLRTPGSLDIEQTRLSPSELQTTVSTGDTRPTNQGIGDLAKPSVLDSVTSAYVTAKGEPLSQEEELSIGIEAIVDGLIGDKTDQDELDSLIVELQEKFGDEKVREALTLAMNLQQ